MPPAPATSPSARNSRSIELPPLASASAASAAGTVAAAGATGVAGAGAGAFETAEAAVAATAAVAAAGVAGGAGGAFVVASVVGEAMPDEDAEASVVAGGVEPPPKMLQPLKRNSEGLILPSLFLSSLANSASTSSSEAGRPACNEGRVLVSLATVAAWSCENMPTLINATLSSSLSILPLASVSASENSVAAASYPFLASFCSATCPTRRDG